MASLAPSQVDAVAVSTSDPAKTLARIAPWTKERYYQVRRRTRAPGTMSALTRRAKYVLTEWGPNSLSTQISRRMLSRELQRLGIRTDRLLLADHHHCHAVCAAYGSGPAVRVWDQGVPAIADVANTDVLALGAVDNVGLSSNVVTLVAALDNLGKGAAGQAVQNMNLMFGLEPGMGLRC